VLAEWLNKTRTKRRRRKYRGEKGQRKEGGKRGSNFIKKKDNPRSCEYFDKL